MTLTSDPKPFSTEASQKELAYPGLLKRGMKGAAVRHLQEWACLSYSTKIVVDGVYGAATESLLSATEVFEDRWRFLTSALRVVLLPPSPLPQQLTFPTLLEQCAWTHRGMHPMEVGGQNRGPWVRLYMDGKEGRDWPWCAGFVSFLLRQTAFFLGIDTPVGVSYSSSILAADARKKGRLVSFEEVPEDATTVFLVRGGKTGYRHTGIAIAPDHAQGTFRTVEGNSNLAGSSEGKEVCSLVRAAQGKDFIVLD